MAAYIKFLAGHLEKLEYRYNRGNKLHCYDKPLFGPALRLTDFADIQITSEEDIKKAGGTLGGALVGGFLLGGVGALAGALSSGNHKERLMVVTFVDGQTSLAKANGPMLEAIQTSIFKHRPNITSAGYSMSAGNTGYAYPSDYSESNALSREEVANLRPNAPYSPHRKKKKGMKGWVKVVLVILGLIVLSSLVSEPSEDTDRSVILNVSE